MSSILEQACLQRLPLFYSERGAEGFYVLSCTKQRNSGILSDFEEAFSLFSKVQQPQNIGKLTRERLEKITKQAILKDQKYAKSIGEKLVVIRGRAGTGKTIKLLHIAYDLCINYDQRCLILTYNKALVSDIRRLIALAKIDSGIATNTIKISTIHSFIYSLMVGFDLIKSSKGDSYFLEKYDKLKAELISYIKGGLVTKNDIQALMRSRHHEVAWDKVLIDEGQDWPEDEKEILFTIFDSKNFIIADGVDQFVRRTVKTDWTAECIFHKPIISEKKSLRQKRNLCKFVQKYAEFTGLNWDVTPKDDLIGGKVIILAKNYDQSLHSQLLSDCEKSGNKPYEMLFLVPPSLVKREHQGTKEIREFALTGNWKNWNIKIWDGTSSDIRSDYPKDVLEHRVLQYDSCRGLEGWITTCIWMDDFFEYKISTYVEPDQEQLSLALSSSDETSKEYAHRWIMIALTRAIDTVVITLRNPNSQYAEVLRNIAESCQDFVEWIE